MRYLFAVLLAAGVWAHDAPANVTVHAHLRVEGAAMRALVRIPMEAVRDVDFPSIDGGYLDVAALEPRLAGLAKLWVADRLTLLGSDPPRVSRTQVSIESDRSFASFEEADAHLRLPLPANSERLLWKQVFFDVALEYPLRDSRSAFALRLAFAELGERVATVVHYGAHSYVVEGDVASLPLEPSWTQAAWLFVRMGFEHILDGMDHLLFLFCLVLSVRQLRPLLWVVTAFTAAHSITLIASVLGMAPDGLWFPPLVELLIAVSIVIMALANIVGWSGHRSWVLAFGFGLVHGFGFSFALRESMQFAGGHLAAALVSFNVGVELGQLGVLAAMVPLTRALFRLAVEERVGTIVLSALVAHTGWHWMWERWAVLGRYTITAPVWSLALVLKGVLAGLVLFVIWRWGRMRL